MEKLSQDINRRRETFLKKYGIGEYFLFVVGAIGILILLYWLATKQLEYSLNELAVLAISFLFIWAPMTLVDLIRKARGLETKK
ncbi:hypothetical protein [Winogradskyella luteola]|uniref:Uncharacterized protein n=1 Tax=Winogradskyella luteola TaxID=2828330 RepID=A0A9X1JME2_9FLAO|nr:hypothetical protein [Winogradskyella luteola]MBV7268360.1 hypothetical protein [Winogradskyella luteola]